MHLIGPAALAMSDLGRIRCQMYFTLTSKLRCYLCWVSMHGKSNMSTRLWNFDHSAGWRQYIRFWDQDHSAGWRQYIRFWDQDHSAGWRKAIRGISHETSAKSHRPEVAWLCQQRGSENKNSTCSTKWENSEATCLPLLQIARLGREVPANQVLRIAVDIRDGVVVIVVPKIPGCSKLPLTRESVWGQSLSTPSIVAMQLTLYQAEYAALNYWIASTCQFLVGFNMN